MITSNRNFIVIKNHVSCEPTYKSNAIFISESWNYDTEQYLNYLSNTFEYVLFVPYYEVPVQIYARNIITLIDSMVEINFCLFYACQTASASGVDSVIKSQKEKRLYIIDRLHLSKKHVRDEYINNTNYITAIISQEGSFRTPEGPDYNKISWHKNLEYLLDSNFNLSKELLQIKLDGCHHAISQLKSIKSRHKGTSWMYQSLYRQSIRLKDYIQSL